MRESKLFGPSNDDDDDDDINQKGNINQEGQELANEFYEQLRARDQEEGRRPPPHNDNDIKQNKKTKFTGKNLTPPDASTRRSDQPYFTSSSRPSSFNAGAGMFGGSSSSSSSQSPRDVMMQREYELVERADRNLVFQGGLALIMLIFYIYIYQTGGIVTGEEAVMGGAAGEFGGGADDLLPFQDVIPLPQDTETSVWL